MCVLTMPSNFPLGYGIREVVEIEWAPQIPTLTWQC